MGTDSMIYFRTDGNSKIATGHLMRCLSIARALRSLKKEGTASICFLVSDGESAGLLQGFLGKETEFPVHILSGAVYNNLEQELPELISILQSPSRKPVLFLDSYFITEDYLRRISAFARIAYLDDLQAFDYPVDLVINYDVVTSESLKAYESAYSSAGKRLLGAAYVPLREQFLSMAKKPPSSGKAPFKDDFPRSGSGMIHLLIASGGSDPYHTCFKLVRYLTDSLPESICYHVVIGKLNSDQAALQQLAEENPLVMLHEQVTDMAGLMGSCDLAISAAGTTLYELCAMGIPTASFILADNQKEAACAFQAAGAIPLLGDIRTQEAGLFAAARDWLLEMIRQKEKRMESARIMQQLVDGRGALRIAEHLFTL